MHCNPNRLPPRLALQISVKGLGQRSLQAGKAKNGNALPPRCLRSHHKVWCGCLHFLKVLGRAFRTVLHCLPHVPLKDLAAGSCLKLKLGPRPWLLKLHPLHHGHYRLRHGPCSSSNLRAMYMPGLPLLHLLYCSLVIPRCKHNQLTATLTGSLQPFRLPHNLRFRKYSSNSRRAPCTILHSQVLRFHTILEQNRPSRGTRNMG